jgi:hypothetical protein
MHESDATPGFSIERRRLLHLPPALAAMLLSRSLFASGPALDSAAEGSDALSWEAFLDQSTAAARRIVASPSYVESAYLFELAALAVRISEVPRGRTGAFGHLDPKVEFGPLYRGTPFFVIEWRLDPGATLPPHNHPNYNVLTVALEGECMIRHYQPEGATPEFSSTDGFLVRRTREALLAKGRVSPLTSTSDNIHTFHAGPLGARGIDIGTPKGKDAGFSFLKIANEARDPERAVFEAHWTSL